MFKADYPDMDKRYTACGLGPACLSGCDGEEGVGAEALKETAGMRVAASGQGLVVRDGCLLLWEELLQPPARACTYVTTVILALSLFPAPGNAAAAGRVQKSASR